MSKIKGENNKKKVLAMILALAMLSVLAACGAAPAQTGTDTPAEAAEAGTNGINIMCGGTAGLSAALINCPSSGSIEIINESEAGNAIILCEGSYGTVLGGEEAVVASDYTGEIVK